MNCTQKQQLVCFPKVRVYKPWFRHFNDHKDFRNEGTVHLFSLMALFSYANFRSNERVIYGDRHMEAPGQWICKLGALPRILRVHSKAQALELMEYFRNHGFLTFEILDEEKEILRFTIADWKEHCTHLQYNYYSYKGSGFFFFPLPVGRLLLKTARKEVGIVFSELDAIMDMWLHTILNDPQVRGSEYMPVVYYSNKVNFFEAVYLLQPDKGTEAEQRIMKLVTQTPLSVPELVRCFENDVRDVSSADKVISAIYTEESDNQARLNNACSLSNHRQDVLEATTNLYLTRQVILEHA